ncbi:MAG: S41 family peptidase, partial [Planctomycetota bacterium]
MRNQLWLLFVYLGLSWGVLYADLSEQIEAILQSLEICREADYWKQVQNLELLGDDAINLVIERIDKVGPRAKLGCAKFLCSVGELEIGFETLFSLMKDKKILREIKVQAAEMLVIEGDPGNATFEAQIEDLMDQTFDPFIKIPLAKALQMVCGNTRGRKELSALLASDNIQVKLEASLALAETENFEQSQLILGSFQREPNIKGLLSKALLKKDKMYKRYEQLIFQYRRIPTYQSSEFEDKVLDEVYQKILSYHINGDQFGKEFLTYAAIDGMLNAFDLECFHIAESDLQRFETCEEERALGLVLGYREKTLLVIAPLFKGPAYFAGIKSGDVLSQINEWSTYDKSREKINAFLQRNLWEEITTLPDGTHAKKGPRPITLKISRPGWSETHEFTLKTDFEIEKKLSTFYYSELLPEKIGYLFFPKLSQENVQKALIQLKEWKANQQCQALILDLRGCALGMLLATTSLLEAFLPPNSLLYREKGKNKELVPEKEYFTQKEADFPEWPLVVLVDQGTAFTGEIVAEALKHHKRASVVGQRTIGEGFIQKLLPLQSLQQNYLKLTVGFYEFPNGTPIHRKYTRTALGNLNKTGGVFPDEFVSSRIQEKSWYQEEWQLISETETFQNAIKAIPIDQVPALFKQPINQWNFLQPLHQKLLTPLPLEEFLFLSRQELYLRYVRETGRYELDGYGDEFFRLAL